MMHTLSYLSFLLLLFASSPFGSAPQTPAPVLAPSNIQNPKAKTETLKVRPHKRYFLKIRDIALFLGDAPFRNIGVNMPDLYERFLNNDDAAAIAMLTEAKTTGALFARCWGTTWGPENFGLFRTDRARWLAAFDRMLAAADAQNMAVAPSLLFNIHALHEYVNRAEGKNEQVVDYLTPGSASNRLAVEYVTAIVSRYKNDTRVLFWEIGNEYNLEADLSSQHQPRPPKQIPTSDQIRAFLTQMAALIHRLDKNHPVTSGNADMRPAAWHLHQAMAAHHSDSAPTAFPMDWTKDSFPEYQQALDLFNPPGIDILSVHQYAPKDSAETPAWLLFDPTNAQQLSWASAAALALQKPLFAGEFNQAVWANGSEQPTPWLSDYLARLQRNEAPLSAIWAWDYRPDSPDQTAFSISPIRTPRMVERLAAANAAIAAGIVNEANAAKQSLPDDKTTNPPPNNKKPPRKRK